jgi:hypothetical protein
MVSGILTCAASATRGAAIQIAVAAATIINRRIAMAEEINRIDRVASGSIRKSFRINDPAGRGAAF